MSDTLQLVVVFITAQLNRNDSTNVRYASEALAKFTIDATALRRGYSRL